jgi:S1-C subfamily serine protease/tetratricopeptide (TPR) repeat protein
MKRCPALIAACLALGVSSSTLFAAQGRGRGMGGGGGGGSMFSGDWMRWQQQRKEDDAKKKQQDAEKKTKERSLQLLAEGWSNLKAGDTAAAVDAFTDALEMKVDEAEARLGIGLSKASDGYWTFAQKQFELAARIELPKVEQPKPKAATKPAAAGTNGGGRMTGQNGQNGQNGNGNNGNGNSPGPGRFRGFGTSPEEQAAEAERKDTERIDASKAHFAHAENIRRLANYNLAVIYTRQGQKAKAAVSLNTILASYKSGATVDEMVLNAMKSLIGPMDDAAKKGIGLLPVMLRTAGEQDRALAAKYPNAERFGIGWVTMGTASQLRQAGKPELYASELPFVLPDQSVLKGKKSGGIPTNLLLPDLAAAATNELVASANIGGKPILPKPIGEVATGNPPDLSRPTVRIEKPTLSSGRPPTDSSVTIGIKPPADVPGTITPPATPETPAPPVAVAPAAEPAAETQITGVTVRGAAFCVAPGVMATCARTVAGASTMRVVATDGDTFDAELISIDEASGIALLKVPEKEFKPLPLGDKLKSGAAMVACFAKAGVFAPELDILRGTVTATTGKTSVSMSAHPRSAGAPIVDDQGRVIGIISATRDDPTSALPVISVEALKGVLAGKYTPSTAQVPPDAAVAELTVTRK